MLLLPVSEETKPSELNGIEHNACREITQLAYMHALVKQRCQLAHSGNYTRARWCRQHQKDHLLHDWPESKQPSRELERPKSLLGRIDRDEVRCMPAALSLRHPRDADPVGTWNARAHGLMHGQWAQTGLLDRGSESGP